MSYVPRVEWRGYRVTAGMAYYRLGVIGLSSRVLKTPEAVRKTLAHEYAHLLAVHRHGRKAANHGPHWQRAMLDIGEVPEVRHRYEVERNVARQQVVYQCGKCGAQIVRKRRLPGRRRYLHVGCGGLIRFVAVERLITSDVPAPSCNH